METFVVLPRPPYEYRNNSFADRQASPGAVTASQQSAASHSNSTQQKLHRATDGTEVTEKYGAEQIKRRSRKGRTDEYLSTLNRVKGPSFNFIISP
jgi:hypothetical protein